MEVLSSEEDNSEVVFLERALLRISLHRPKQDLLPHKLLLLVLRRQAHFALATVPEDLWLVLEAEVIERNYCLEHPDFSESTISTLRNARFGP